MLWLGKFRQIFLNPAFQHPSLFSGNGLKSTFSLAEDKVHSSCSFVWEYIGELQARKDPCKYETQIDTPTQGTH